MRTLPQAWLGTFLVAFAAWVAGCAGLWYVVPTRPKVALDNFKGDVGFTTDGRHFYTHPVWFPAKSGVSTEAADSEPLESRNALRVWEVETGRCVLEWRPTGDVYMFRPKHALALVAAGDAVCAGPKRLDLIRGRHDGVPWSRDWE